MPRDRLYRFDARLLMPALAAGLVATVLVREFDIHATARDIAWRRLHDAAMALGAIEVLSARVMLEMTL